MAKVKNPLFSLGASGSIAKKITMRQTSRGQVALQHSAPYSKNKGLPSQAQLDQRAFYGSLVEEWRGLDAGEIANYVLLGEAVGLTGWQYFVQQGGLGIQVLDYNTFSLWGTLDRYTINGPYDLSVHQRRSDNVSFYRDFGSGYFNGNFKHRFRLRVNVGPTNAYGVGFPWAVGNVLGDSNDFAVSGTTLCLRLYNSGGLKFEVIEYYNGSSQYIQQFVIAINTYRYIEIERVSNIGPFGTAYFRIYSDPDFTNLINEAVCTQSAAFNANYLYAGASLTTGQFNYLMQYESNSLTI